MESVVSLNVCRETEGTNIENEPFCIVLHITFTYTDVGVSQFIQEGMFSFTSLDIRIKN